MRPGPGNRIFSAGDMAPLLRYGGTNYEFLSSDLRRLCPINFADYRTRNLVTSISYDIDRPVPVPYVWDRTVAPYSLNGVYPYTLAQTAFSLNTPFNQATLSSGTVLPANTPGRSEFDPSTWRSILTTLGKVNMSRSLTPYPTPSFGTGLMATDAVTLGTFNQAQADRQQFAQDIFYVLQQITGARYPLNPAEPTLVSTNYPAAQWNALRALAQISVNLVDFIDQDDIITPFNWSVDPTDNMVYGVEMPRLVINEVYFQMNNNPADVTAKMVQNPYNVNVWVELLNPINASTDPLYSGAPQQTIDPEAWLMPSTAAYSMYQLVIANNGINNPTVMQNPANVLGDPTYGGNPGNVIKTVTDFNNNAAAIKPIVYPANGAFQGTTVGAQVKGFFCLGPQNTNNANYAASDDPMLTTTALSANLTYTVPNTTTTLPTPVVLLQRLLCPSLPLQTATNGATPYNPYITVDYVVNTSSPGNVGNVFDQRQYIGNAQNPNPGLAINRQAMGRREPYAAAASQFVAQQLTNTNGNTFAYNTFLQHNATVNNAANLLATDATLQVPFDWLVHLDRQLISKSEILYASTCKPHELTQLFVQQVGATNVANCQNVDSSQTNVWLNQSTFLYRFFEFATIRSLMAGFSHGGRVPGRINTNVLNDPAIFSAIADAENGNYYSQLPNSVTTVWTNLINGRQPTSGYTGTGSTPIPQSSDAPIWGFGPGPATGGDALSNTARGLTVNTLLPPVSGATNPYQKYEMLNKILNNTTTRSNVFAVWMTVGFFEVTNTPSSAYMATSGPDFSAPPILGAEIGKAENRNIRHRMFAIVDRTNLQIFQTTSTAAIVVPRVGTASTSPITPMGQLTTTVTLASTSSTVAQSGFQWSLQPGSVLTYDPNTDTEETVVVQPGLTATFFRNHSANCIVIGRGNPGPSSLVPYNPRNDPLVVPHFAIID